MPRSLRAFVCLLTVSILLTACGSTPRADLDDGWDWMVRRNVASEEGADFDNLTGEVIEQQGLALPTMEGDGPVDDVAAEVVADLCEDFIDMDWGQSHVVRLLLEATVSEAISVMVTDEYADANRAVAGMMEENGPSFDGVPLMVDGELNPEWDAISDERTALADEYRHSQYPELTELRDEIAEMHREMYESVFTEETVRDAQDLFVKRCDVEVADGFEFPSGEELGIVSAPSGD